MFLGVNYSVEISQKEGRLRARLLDGSTPVVSVSLTEGLSANYVTSRSTAPSVFERHDASVRHQDDIIPGLTIFGEYESGGSALTAIRERFGLHDCRLTAVLSWCSYLTGMELPGESALLSKVVLQFQNVDQFPSRMAYGATVTAVDSRFGHIKTDVSLRCGDSTIAAGQIWSFVRSSVTENEEIVLSRERSDSLIGKTAVLLGSSRGLGAATKLALELRGARVYGMARYEDPNDLSRTEVGDAADPEALRRLRKRVSKESGRLDFIICNACPPILPLRLEPNAKERIADYISRAISLTLTPLSEFLDLLSDSDGCAVIISSAAVERPVREWPHYVAAKRAVEALGCVVPLQYPRVSTLIVRPQKLLTAMTNTTLGRAGALSPQHLANRIASRLENPLEPGKTEILGEESSTAVYLPGTDSNSATA